MLKLINLSTYEYDIARFNYDINQLTSFLEKYDIDGVELLNPINWNENFLPKKVVKGIHLRYYPVWLDFWKDNRSELLRQFKNKDTIEEIYGGINKETIIEHYKKEIDVANKMGAEYVVFHVSHVQLEHVFNYNFTYSDCEVIDAAAELINEVFKDLNTNVKLLFENLWWPGLTMLDKNMAARLLDKVQYSNKGFMLDTAHLMNTNLQLKDERQAVTYLLNTINNLGELKPFIKGLHLNCSLSGKYVIEQMNNKIDMCKDTSFNEMLEKVFSHVSNIDRHEPFTDECVKDLIEYIKPEYFVYEFITSSLEQLEEYIKTQNGVFM
ncbi:TIM barrel protein [Clostridium aciditolerans]|uniref:TIM barrel protein n=1 Tax=Clostridium aciditolerans TaxID=339861 RepID=A0A934M3R7_9CLOT|nr:TIM barrel protein [Clostridium aciditolerans]MBI6871873.1 TIM barrel protein [Clostridium aciditolerans]